MHIIHDLEEDGGMEQLLVEHVIRTDRQKVYPMVCSLLGKGTRASQLESFGIPVFQEIKRGRLDVGFPLRLTVLLKEMRADVVQTYSGVYRDGCLAGLLARVPVIVHTDHGRFNKNSKWTRWNHRFFSRFRDRIIGVSNGVGKFLVDEVGIPSEKIVTIYDGVDIGAFETQVDRDTKLHELGLPEDRLLVGIVGRMVPVKDHETFFRAAQLVLQKVKKVTFLVAGDGPLEANLKEMVCGLEISEHIRFLGFRNDVHELMNLFDLVVVSSTFESFSLVLAEAMVCKKAVVATRVGGIPEVVEDGVTGLLVPPQKPELLARAVVELLKDEQRRKEMGQAGKIRVRERFSIETMVRSYEDLYTSLLEQKGLVAHE